MNPRRTLCALYLLLVAFVATGCATLVDTDAMRLCRTLIPILDPHGTRIVVLESIETRPGRSGAFVAAIDYTIPGPSEVIVRRIVCTFATRDWSQPDAAVHALSNVTTTDGDIGTIRLWLLKRFWLDSGEAAAADPAPFATLGRTPEVPASFATAAQILVSSLPIISSYALLALAYALLYGLTGRINLAFGELTILGGYAAFLGYTLGIDRGTGMALALGLTAGVVTAGLHGAAFGRVVVAPLLRAPGQHVLIATLGMAIAWSEFVRLTQGSGNRWIPPLLNRPLALMTSGEMTVTMTPMAVAVAASAAAAALAVVLLLRLSRYGRHWRSVADDPYAAALCGVDAAAVLSRTLLLTAGLAGLSGILTAAYYGGVGFSGGIATALKALVAAILGGIANPVAALLGGIVLGLTEAAWSWAFPIEMRDPAVFVLLALTLALKPQGLFAKA